jgi:hypothetical protein
MPLQSRSIQIMAIRNLRRYSLRTSLLAVVVTVWLPNAESADQANDTATQVKRILEIGWNASIDNYSAAQALFTQAKHDAPGDVRVDFAMALVSLQNHNLEDASIHLSDVLPTDKSLLPIRRVQVWVLINRHNEAPAAKAAIMNLARTLKTSSSSTNPEAAVETAHWLGRVVGYYSGPGSDLLKPDELAALDTEVSSGLEGAQAQAYSDGKAVVATMYKQLRQKLVEERSSVKEDNESKLAIDFNQNAAASRIVSREKNDANVFLQQVIQKVAQGNPALNAQRSMLEKDLSNTKAEKKRLEKDDDKGNNRREIDQDEEKIKQLEKELTPVMNKLRANEADLNAADQTVRRLSKTEDDLSAKHRELEKKLEKPVPDKDSTTAAVEQKLKSVTTYVGLNLPRERLRILDSFRDHQVVHKDN